MNLYWPKFESERRRTRKRLSRWAQAEKRAKTALVLSHGGCLDGTGAAIVTLRALGPENVGVAYAQPTQVPDALEFFAKSQGRGRRLLVADLSLQPDDLARIVVACAKLRSSDWSIEWRDHHHKQWEDLDLSALEEHVRPIDVNKDATESGASLQQQALAPDDAFMRSLAETIRDRDLWWNKTPDSATLEMALSELGVRAFQDHYVSRAPGPVVDDMIRTAASRDRSEQEAVKERLLGETRRFGDGEVAVVYGWLPKNTGLHDLIEKGAKIAINVRPNGKLSLRSEKRAAVCHLVAREFGGGGHPNASGGDLGLKGPRYWWYIVRRGRVKRVQALGERAVQVLRENPVQEPTATRHTVEQSATTSASNATKSDSDATDSTSKKKAASRKKTPEAP